MVSRKKTYMKQIKKLKKKQEENKKYNVAAYCRVSSQSERQLHSLSEQVSYYSKLIQNTPDWIYAGVYSDEGLTGRNTERPEFQRMMNNARNGMIDIVLCKSISRLSRDTVDCIKTIRELKELGIAVIFEKENINTLTQQGELLLSLLASFAQQESKSLGDNVSWGIIKRFKEGKGHHDRMYGYDIIDKKLVINKQQAKVVKYIFRKYIEGFQPSYIAMKLNNAGIKSPSGKDFNNISITRILQQERYTGRNTLQKSIGRGKRGSHRVNKGELPMYIVEDYQPAIIDRKTFIEAQIARERTKRPNRIVKKKTVYPLDYKIKCKECGSFYGRHSSNRNVYWRCNGTQKMKICHAHNISEVEIMKQLKGIDLNKVELIMVKDKKVMEVIKCQNKLL